MFNITRKKLGILIAIVLVVSGLFYRNAAAAWTTTARWDFNEAGAIHPDSTANGITATSGTEVVNTGTTIRMPFVADWKTALHPQRLTRANDPRLNPGTGDFSVAVSYKTTQKYGNLIQKGQNGAKGGYFKIELPEGNVTCLFKDSTGTQRAVISPLKYNDGTYHTIRCERLSTGINLYVNDVRVAHTSAHTGNISNTVDLTIGGKGNCDQLPGGISCDYFPGEIDFVQIDAG